MRRLFGMGWRHSKQGAAAAEFAVVAPFLISLLLGAGDIAPTMIVKFKSANATHSAADLTTQF